jgi:hypothetical protein
MVARSTVSRYVLSTRVVHLPEHADGGVPDRFRVRELRRSLCFRISFTNCYEGSARVRCRLSPSAAIVTHSARAASPPHSLHAISNRPSHMYGKAVVIAARPVQLPYGSCVRRWVRQHHAAGSRTVR